MMNPHARIAVIGTGWWATYAHIPAILENPDAEISAICDPHPERLEKTAKAFNVIHTYTDHREMLEKERQLDGVIIATPHATHYAIARDCLESNLHVLIEKPMTLYAAEAAELVSLAKERNKEILIGYPNPHSPAIKRAREVFASGELGRMQFLTSIYCSDVFEFLNGRVSQEHSPTPNYTVNSPSEAYNNPELLGGGEGHLQLTHSISTALFVTSQRARKVHALMKNFGLAVDLVDVMMVEFESDAIGNMGGSGNAGKSYEFNLTVYCEYGNIILSTSSQKGWIRKHDGSEENLMALMEKQPIRRFAVTHNFINVILRREENGSPGELGWRTVEILDAAYRSASRNGEGVYIADLYKP